MTRARDIANLGTQAGSGLDASDITTGVLPVGVTGGSGLNALTFPAGMTELLATVTASSSTTIDFNSTYVTATHDSYELHVMGAYPSADMGDVTMSFSYDNGAGGTFYNFSWGSFHKQFNGTNLTYLGNSSSGQTPNDTTWNIGGGGEGGSSAASFGGIVRMTNMNAVGTEFSHGDSLITYPHSASAAYGTYSSYYMDQASGRTNFIRLTSTQTITSGVFKLYGRIA